MFNFAKKRKLLPVICTLLSSPWMSSPAFSATISAISMGVLDYSGQSLTQTETGTNWYMRTAKIEFIPDNGTALDTTCMTVTGSLNLAHYTIYQINGWGVTEGIEWNSAGNVRTDLTIKNQCGMTASGLLKITYLRPDNSISFESHQTIDSSSCSVEVDTNPKIPDITPGKAVNEVNISAASTDTGILTFVPNAWDDTGGKLMNGDMHLNYSVTGATWDNSKGEWVGDLSEHNLKINDVPSSTAPGTYTGTMAATISCE